MLYPSNKSIKIVKVKNIMGYPKKHRGRRKWALKKDVLEKKIRKNNFFERYTQNKKI